MARPDEHLVTAIVSIALALIGLTAIALLVSPSARTGTLFGTSGQTLAEMISCALSPVTGAGCGTSVTSSISFGGIPPTRSPVPSRTCGPGDFACVPG